MEAIALAHPGKVRHDAPMVDATTDKPTRFFLQAMDADLGCPVLEAAFDVADLDELRALLGSCADDDPELRHCYFVDTGELAAIGERFGVAFDPGDREVQLNRWDSLRAIPYLVHTRYELPLLLNGTKKFAWFLEVYPPYNHHNEELFDRYVAEGLLHKEIHLEPFPEPHTDGRVIEGSRDAYYTPKGEEWRIRAWKLVHTASRKTEWNEDFERIQGMLFGYEEWQMDWWINHIREQRQVPGI
jgi:hypothetical protein